jgi:hypothetical protein
VQDRVRYYEIAGITIQVESDLPINDRTFHHKFTSFRADGPGVDTVVIRHHFGLPEEIPGFAGPRPPEEVYRKSPWAIYRAGESWVYLGIAPQPGDPTLHCVAVFSADYSQADIYNSTSYGQAWRDGELASLTMFPTDQILLARLVADREACYLHSGGLTIDGQGFIFVGHSEAGKSTTMRLVSEELGDRSEILCDDRNIVRRWPEAFRGGPAGFYVHGTWSHGDVPEVSSACAPLRAILFLEQHEHNEIVLVADKKRIWQSLLATVIRPLVTAEWWRREMDLLEQIVGEVPCYTMRFDKSGKIVADLEKMVR